MTLYELTDEATELMAALLAVESMAAADEQHTDEYEQALDVLNARLDEMTLAIAGKGDRYAWVIKELAAQAEAYKARAVEFAAKQKARENAAKRLKDRIKEAMEQLGVDILKGAEYTLALQNNPPRVAECDEEAALAAGLAEEVRTVKVDGKAIIAAHKAGTLPEGVATVEQGSHLRIR